MIKSILRFVKKLVFGTVSLTFRVATLLILLLITIVEGPQIHSNFIRAVAAPSIVFINVKASEKEVFQGTGFHLVAPSGKVVLITNRHVCEDSTDGKILVTPEGSMQTRETKIVKMSRTSDLCMAEPIPGIEGLTMASGLSVGEAIITLGHPDGLPLMPNFGEAIGVYNMAITAKMNDREIASGMCKWDNSKIEDKEEDGEKFKTCTETNRAVATSAQVVGGSSGSPMLNRYGLVTGVVYARGANNWASSIPLSSLREFLKNE